MFKQDTINIHIKGTRNRHPILKRKFKTINNHHSKISNMEQDEFLGGEYDNIADLMGIDTDGGDLLGRISRLPKERQAGVLKKLMRPNLTIGENSSRQELEKKFAQLPREIREGLIKKRLQLVDTRFYIVKDISGKQNVDVFQGTDNKNVGLGNIANQKLEKDNWFIISAIRMLYGESPTGREVTDFKELSPAVMNGEFELEAGQKKVVGLITNDVFDTRLKTDTQIGHYKLHSTKIIEPQVEIKMPVKFAAPAAANSFLKVVFIGTSVVPF